MSRPNKSAARQTVRCAIYTRKSSEEGLDQAFNSLHAQRESCEAYVLSQAGEGWRALPAVYDDGGFSGGNMDRPALKRLLVDVAAGHIDVIVVYKVDRLTRSLTDFAKIVDVLDAREVSFVSVTQAFNTTSSMGRLTLNVLLSFAQFEREVTGERIRDKIAASKAKGIWMGGMVPMGYDTSNRELVINEAEAEQVRSIFRRYLELGSVPALKAELDRTGVRSKEWTSRNGRSMGGARLSCGALFHLLQNRLYRGLIVHKLQVHPGLHAPIVDEPMFQAVQERLAGNRVVRRARPTRVAKCPLTGIIFDEHGVLMSPSFAYGRRKIAYRYYVSAAVCPKRDHPKAVVDGMRRVSAPSIEELVLDRVRRALGSPEASWTDAKAVLSRVDLRPDAVEIVLARAALARLARSPSKLVDRLPEADDLRSEGRGEEGRWRLTVPVRPVFRGGRVSMSGPAGRPAVRKPNPLLIRGLRNAHQALALLSASPLGAADRMAAAQALADFNSRRIFPIAFLAPDIQQAILEGRQPATLSVKRMVQNEVPLAWVDQRRKFGFSAPANSD